MSLDILEFWEPEIEWARFKQGSVSDAVWNRLRRVVILCHAFRHWDQDAGAKRSSPPRHLIFPEESSQDFKGRQAQWKRDIEQSETYKHRAKHLASDEVAKLAFLGTNAEGTKGTPDWKLWYASRLMVAANPAAGAFDSFDADKELKDEVDVIASRWLKEKGRDNARPFSPQI